MTLTNYNQKSPTEANKNVVIVEGFRTPFVPIGGVFSNMPAGDLGVWLLRELLERTQIPVDEIANLIIGNTFNSLKYPNIAHYMLVKTGLSQKIFAETLSRQEFSSMESVISAFHKIRLDSSRVVIAGGVESMSQMSVFLSPGMSKKLKLIFQSENLNEKLKSLFSLKFLDFRFQILDNALLKDPITGLHQGQRAEQLAEQLHILREEQDQFALQSFQKALSADRQDQFKEELAVVFPPFDFEMVDRDKNLDNMITSSYLSDLKPCFNKTCGTITIGNSAVPADGAVLLLIMSQEKAKQLGYEPLVSIHTFSYAVTPSYHLALGFLNATARALKQADLRIQDIDLFEIDESFSAQALAYLKAFKTPELLSLSEDKDGILTEIDKNKCNVSGGALALGHPVSAGSARMVLSLAKQMRRRKVKWGLVSSSLCEGKVGVLILKNNL